MLPHGLDGGRSDFFTKPPTNLLTSFRNSHVRTKKEARNTAENRYGRRRGYPSQSRFPNKLGSLLCECDSDPHSRGLSRVGENGALRTHGAYSIATPSAHTRGKSPDAWALFEESVGPPTMRLTASVFPLKKATIQRLSQISAAV